MLGVRFCRVDIVLDGHGVVVMTVLVLALAAGYLVRFRRQHKVGGHVGGDGVYLLGRYGR